MNMPDDGYDGFGDADSGDFVKVGTAAELDNKGTINKKIIGKWISVFKRDGEVYALEFSCKHHGANLAEGKVEDDVVTCPRHFWKYNVVTGESYTPNSPNLRRHATRIVDRNVYVSLRPIMVQPKW